MKKSSEPENGFGLLIDTGGAEPVTIAKHGRPVAVMLSVEECERLKGLESEKQAGIAPNEPHEKQNRVS